MLATASISFIVFVYIICSFANFNMASSIYNPTFEEKVKRIAEESLEVSFIVCNNELDKFGISKVSVSFKL